MFQLIYRCIKKIGDSKKISAWKSKGFSVETIERPATSNNILSPSINDINVRIRVKFDESSLKHDKLNKAVVNIYIVYEINLYSFKQSADFTLENSLYGAVMLTKNADFDKSKYSEFGIGFDPHISFSFSGGKGFAKNMIIFGADMSSSVLLGNANILILGKCPTQGLIDTTLTVDKGIGFTEQQKKFCLSLQYNGSNSYLFINSVEIYKFNVKYCEINAASLSLSNVLKEFSVDNMRKTELYGYVCDFSVDYDSTY